LFSLLIYGENLLRFILSSHKRGLLWIFVVNFLPGFDRALNKKFQNLKKLFSELKTKLFSDLKKLFSDLKKLFSDLKKLFSISYSHQFFLFKIQYLLNKRKVFCHILTSLIEISCQFFFQKLVKKEIHQGISQVTQSNSS